MDQFYTAIDNLTAYPWVEPGLQILGLTLAALLANFVVKKLLLRGLNRALSRTAFREGSDWRRHGVIPRLANVIPALVISGGIVMIPAIPDNVTTVVLNVTNAFIILTLALAIGAALAVVDSVYHRRPAARLKPIKGYLQVLKIAIYGIATILIVSTLVDRSPVILLSGLGAMAAVLILVFQDTLLSLVAGVQISATDMVRVGDWIEMPGFNADGDVIEISLHTVRVQNWDKTITTIPIRKLVTESVKNWRGMTEAGGRRICRSVNLDQNSVRFLTDEEIARLSRMRLLQEYMAGKRAELEEWNSALATDGAQTSDTRRLTNLGTFRAYLCAYLKTHPGISADMTLLVRQKEPGAQGIPLQVYCFTNTTAWAEYEGIQSDIFDHILAILGEFDLSVFQEIGGNDLRAKGASLLQRVA
jgi:miniconductance mechanosensitive channel